MPIGGLPLVAVGRAALVGLLLALLAETAAAGILVLQDGRAIRYTGELRGNRLLVTFDLEDGTLVSLRRSKVDWEASRRAMGIVAAPPGTTCLPARSSQHCCSQP